MVAHIPVEEKNLVKSRVKKEAASEKSPRPEPFKFEIDPSEFTKGEKWYVNMNKKEVSNETHLLCIG